MFKKTHAWRSSWVNHNSLLWFYTMALFILYAFSFSRMLFKFLITLLTTTFLRTSASIPLWESSRVLDDENIYHVKYMCSATPTIIDKFNPRDCIIIIMNLHVCIERFSFCLAILLSIITVFVLVDVFLLFTLSLW